MATTTWSPTLNTFLINTENNYHRALQISQYLNDKLDATKADADILVLYNHFHPLHLAYTDAYNQWESQIGAQISSTNTLSGLLRGITTQVNTWKYAFYAAGFLPSTPTYIACFPNGVSPFQRGTQLERIQAVKQLSLAMTGITALAATKTSVDNYFTSLNTALTSQQGKIGTTKNLSDAVELARQTMCVGQYWCLGGLMQKYAAFPDTIANFYAITLIQNNAQTDFTGHILGGKMSKIAKRTLVAEQSIHLYNLGSVPIRFYLATNPTDAQTTVIDVPPMSDKTVTADQLGDVTTQHYLMVYNIDANATAQWRLVL